MLEKYRFAGAINLRLMSPTSTGRLEHIQPVVCQLWHLKQDYLENEEVGNAVHQDLQIKFSTSVIPLVDINDRIDSATVPELNDPLLLNREPGQIQRTGAVSGNSGISHVEHRVYDQVLPLVDINDRIDSDTVPELNDPPLINRVPGQIQRTVAVPGNSDVSHFDHRVYDQAVTSSNPGTVIDEEFSILCVYEDETDAEEEETQTDDLQKISRL